MIYHKIDKNLIESVKNVLQKSILAENNPPVGTEIKDITPKEVFLRGLTKTPRSAGEVDPKYQAEFDRRFKEQQDAFKREFPEKEEKDFLDDPLGTKPDARTRKETATTLFGDPTREQDYLHTPMTLKFADLSTRTIPGEPGKQSGGFARGREVTLDPKRSPEKAIAHETGHVQQNSTVDPSVLVRDHEIPYADRNTEAGAELKSQIMKIRAGKSSEESMKPLTDQEVDSAIDNAGKAGYGGFYNLDRGIQQRLKNYMKHMIAKNNTTGQNNQGTIA